MINRKQTTAFITKWQNRLGLHGWQIIVVFGCTDTEDANHTMTIEWPRGYRTATLCIAPNATQFEPELYERVILHEMLHLVLANMDDHLSEEIGDGRVNDVYEALRETTIDSLAVVLQRGWKDGRSRRS
jgi:hypothetical protein